jgi:hypothetical protein
LYRRAVLNRQSREGSRYDSLVVEYTLPEVEGIARLMSTTVVLQINRFNTGMHNRIRYTVRYTAEAHDGRSRQRDTNKSRIAALQKGGHESA